VKQISLAPDHRHTLSSSALGRCKPRAERDFFACFLAWLIDQVSKKKEQAAPSPQDEDRLGSGDAIDAQARGTLAPGAARVATAQRLSGL
jgi:hypothetical protein